jgi:hypothetical protein
MDPWNTVPLACVVRTRTELLLGLQRLLEEQGCAMGAGIGNVLFAQCSGDSCAK